MKNKPDDRSNNPHRIQSNISDTIKNIHLANEMIEVTDDEKTRETLIEKNHRREIAVDELKKELKDETINQEVQEKMH
ncbi:small acid-soluble spore protein Tlp [Clostridium baratii]|uniref:small acid-soluble spore protein Tlp n=1 Tax=Clostridium baratii TaxID=1561 RepID=UPI001CAC92C8|nr:small acid-soluble spore protein Tlp [Clostridium baratii]STB00037.1 small acid-soluble spore protein Tlp [Clostridium baratii]